MSELTPCNYCNLREMRRRAKKRGAKVTTKAGTGEWQGWIVVSESGQDKPIAWFRALTDHCAC